MKYLLKYMFTVLAVMFLAACSNKRNINAVVDSEADYGHQSRQMEQSIKDFDHNVGDRIFFNLNKSDLTDEARAQLDKQITWLKAHHSVKAIIEGHCDERGTREYNLALGEKRASVVKSYMVHNGINAHRLDTISYGKEKPAVLGVGESVWSKNRRAVTVIHE